MKENFKFILDKTGDITLKASSGLIIFLLVDGIVSILLGFFVENVKPFEFTLQLYEIAKNLGKDFGNGYTVLTIYILLWGWGQLVYILRQPLFLDNFKSNYLGKSFNNEVGNIFEFIREKVIGKLILKASDLKNILDKEKTNDYLLYQILGKYKALYPNNKGTREANDIAFIATNIIFILIIVYLYYILEILWSQNKNISILEIGMIILYYLLAIFLIKITPSHTKKYLLYILMFIGIIVVVLVQNLKIYMLNLVFVLSVIIIYFLFLERVRDRLIYRNMKIYINFLLYDSNLEEELKKKED